MTTKQCSICKEIKSISLFYKAKKYKNGIRSSCKKCNYAYSKANRNYKPPIVACKFCKSIKARRRGRIYCSTNCQRKASALMTWNKQKKDPYYPKYHRNYMKNWLRNKRKNLTI
jgi:hypothetical protein